MKPAKKSLKYVEFEVRKDQLILNIKALDAMNGAIVLLNESEARSLKVFLDMVFANGS